MVTLHFPFPYDTDLFIPRGSDEKIQKGFVHISQSTDQASAPATEAGVLQPSPHVLVGADDQRPDHEDPLPVLYDTLTTLKEKTHKKEYMGRRVKPITPLLLPSERETNLLN